MMKRVLIAILALMLACGVLPCSAFAEEGTEGAATRLLDAQEQYLKANDQLLYIDQWAQKWVDTFFAEPTYESQLRAITAVSAAKKAFDGFTLPELQVQSADLIALTDANADVLAAKEWNPELTAILRGYRTDYYCLLFDILMQSAMLPLHPALSDYHNALQQYRADHRQYICCEANYILLQLGETEETWHRYEEAYPYLFADHPAWDADTKHLEEEGGNALDRTSAFLMGLENNIWRNAIDSDYADMMDDLSNGGIGLDDMLFSPDMVDYLYLAPEWNLGDGFSYTAFQCDAEGHVVEMPCAGDDLTGFVPNGGMLIVPDITGEAVRAYSAYLAENWCDMHVMEETEERFLSISRNDFAPMILEWNPDVGATITFMDRVGILLY